MPILGIEFSNLQLEQLRGHLHGDELHLVEHGLSFDERVADTKQFVEQFNINALLVCEFFDRPRPYADLQSLRFLKAVHCARNQATGVTPPIIFVGNYPDDRQTDFLRSGADICLRPTLVSSKGAAIIDPELILLQISKFNRLLNQKSQTLCEKLGLTIDEQSGNVSLLNYSLNLRPAEFNVLKVLAKNPGKYCSENFISDIIYSFDGSTGSNTIDVYIGKIRKKIKAALETLGLDPELEIIGTKHRLGWYLRVDNLQSLVDQSSPQSTTTKPGDHLRVGSLKAVA